MKKKLMFTFTMCLSLLLFGNVAFATVAPKVVPKVIPKVVPKVIPKKVIPKVLPLIYTWDTVRTKMLNANIGPNFKELKDIYDGVPFVRLDYNYMPEYANGRNSYSNVFNISSLKGKVPNMDIGLGVFGNHSGDAKVTANANLAGELLYEAIFPNQGKAFNKLLEKVNRRYVVKGNQHVNLPTVIFFGGRRVILDVQKYYYSIDFSAINDKTDIWKEIYRDESVKHVMPNKAELKKHMPELKNY